MGVPALVYDLEYLELSGLLQVCGILVCITVAVQAGYNLRQAYTDEVRYRQDTEKTEFGSVCRRTEMYGWSFYEWDYSVDNPTGATHRIAGFVQAYTGNGLNENSTEEERAAAAELAEAMPDFPETGSILMTEEFVVVKLSDRRERTNVDWW